MKNAERRLDAMIDSLRQVEPSLDDVTRARVGAELQVSLREPAAPARTPGRARVLLAVGGVGVAAAAALALALAFGADGPTVGGGHARSPAAPPPEWSAGAARTLAPGAAIDVVPGSTERIAVGGAEVTVYGPGRVSARAVDPAGPVAVVEAEAALVDRAAGAGTWALTYGDLDVRVTRATFALDRTVAPRVTVMRGELLLRCPAAAVRSERTVHAGESATCVPAPAPAPPATPAPRVEARTAAVETPARPSPPPSPLPSLPPATSSDRYADADLAMRRGDRPAARVALEALVAARPGDRDAATALLDLARLVAPTDAAAARGYLDALEAHPHRSLVAEPAAYLRCTLVPGGDRAGRIDCLGAYYRGFPDAPRAAAVLARLAVLHAATDCATAAPLLVEYLVRFPDGPDRAAVSAWRDRCAAP